MSCTGWNVYTIIWHSIFLMWSVKGSFHQITQRNIYLFDLLHHVIQTFLFWFIISHVRMSIFGISFFKLMTFVRLLVDLCVGSCSSPCFLSLSAYVIYIFYSKCSLIFPLSIRLEGSSFHLRHQCSRRGQRHQPGVPRGRTLHLRLQPFRPAPRTATWLAVGRLRWQCALRLQICPWVCRRQRKGEELPARVAGARPDADEPAQ